MMSWEEFCEQFTDALWFDEDRQKTLSALRRVHERVPSDALEDLDVLVFAPGSVFGRVYPRSTKTLIYISPDAENQSQDDLEFTVAHEFAHAVLGHQDYWTHDGRDIEDEADALATKWGFTVPARRRDLR